MKNDLMPRNGKDFPSYKDLSDEEFVREVERLSNGYYHEYLRENMVEKPYINPHLFETGTESCHADVGTVSRPPRMRTISGCLIRRVPLLILDLLFSVFAFVVAFVPYFPDNLFGWVKNKTIGGADIFISLFGKGDFYALFGQATLQKVFGYLTAGMFVAYLLLVLTNIILSACSLAEKPAEDETFKRYPLTVLCVTAFVCVSVSVLCCALLTGSKGFCYGGLWHLFISVLLTVFTSYIYRDDSKKIPVIRPKEEWEVLR